MGNTANTLRAKPGSLVTFTMPGKTEPLARVLGTQADKAREALVLACNTPIGKALLGKKVGEEVQVERLDGSIATIKLLSVEDATTGQDID